MMHMFGTFLHCNFLDRNGLWLLQYSISKQGAAQCIPYLVEIELLRRSVRGLFLSTYGTSQWTCLYKIFLLKYR